MATYKRPVSTSEPWDFTLKEQGEAKDLSDFSAVELIISTTKGNVVTAPSAPVPTVAFLSKPAGTVRVSGAENLALGNYFVRFKLTDGAGKVFFVPADEEEDACDVWTITGIPKHPA